MHQPAGQAHTNMQNHNRRTPATRPTRALHAAGKSDYESADYEGENGAAEMQNISEPNGTHGKQEPEQKVYIRFKNLKKIMNKGKRPLPGKETTGGDNRPSKRSKVKDNVELLSSPSPMAASSSKKQTNGRSKQNGSHTTDETIVQPQEGSPSNLKVTPVNLTDIPEEVKELFTYLTGTGLKALPDIENHGVDQPWTAERLTHLYIYSASEGDTELCDLIVDVWIRAFQDHDRYVTRDCTRLGIYREDLHPDELVWGENKHHPDRANYMDIGMPPIPKWQMHKDLALPKLHNNVTAYSPKLLNQLYKHTPKDNAARRLWADSLALCGDRTQYWLMKLRKDNIQLHPDLTYNILCTTLRMARRKLTLKIEELGEDAWCHRYHAHGKDEQCYRARARMTDNLESTPAQTPAKTPAQTPAPADTPHKNGDTTCDQESSRHVHFAQNEEDDLLENDLLEDDLLKDAINLLDESEVSEEE